MTFLRLPPLSIRGKLTLAAVVPLASILLLVAFGAYHLINGWIVDEAQNKVRTDLGAARALLQNEEARVADIVRLTANVPDLAVHLAFGELDHLGEELDAVRRREGLDLLVLVDAAGRALLPASAGAPLAPPAFVGRVLAGEHYAGAALLGPPQLALGGEELVRRAAIHAPARAGGSPAVLEERGLLLVGASPVAGPDGRVAGCLYGGILLNGNLPLVDRIEEIVYGPTSLANTGPGTGTGSATIFLGDLRAATTIRLSGGERAIGTRVSAEVARAVLERRETWIDRARVVDRWYLTAYEPILDASGAAIGALYVGLLEEPFNALKTRSALTLLGLLLLGCGLGYLLARVISKALCRPVLKLNAMALQVAAGKRDLEIEATTRDEIGHLTGTFNRMATALKERENDLNRLNRELEGEVAVRTRQLEEKSLELIAAQQELLRSEKLAAIGSLAAGVAHEINNPAAIIRGNVEILQMELPPGASGREEADEILKQTERISLITQNMLTFAREQSFRFDTVELNGLLAEILSQVSHQVELGRVEVIEELDLELPPISSDGPRLRQVLTNIVVNGLQAMDGEGRLTVRSRFDEREVVLAVADTGPGMDAATREKIFNPFFTTKDEGTGLGLSVSYGIVQALGGRIAVESSPGEGATFTVRIPRQPPGSGGE
ncbi:MAG: histidine kinase [Desulfuromonas sp.]|uniref:sensor histidine kinase n=1 Tax=Desulfuromonas sp. TaxID=892 RepID=UPI000CB07361|nr:cache domain-containing protein [Desulfuromonas sp.]PLX83464.1 MAG: histidine kinase [Desulfuromonas sp.]